MSRLSSISDDSATDGAWTTQSFNAANETGTYTPPGHGSGGCFSAPYDAAGNMTTLANGDTAVYDAWDRLVAVKQGSNVVEQCEYDGTGRRIQIATNPGGQSTVENDYFSGQQVIESDTLSSLPSPLSTIYQYVWSPRNIDAPILRDTLDGGGSVISTDRLFYLDDANYNVTAVIDSSGAVQERYSYDPYGTVTFCDPSWNPETTTRATDNTILFAGQQWDAITGLYNMRARYYDPQTEAFITQDPLGYAGSGANLYEYCGDRPMMETDPFGLSSSYSTFISSDSGGGYQGCPCESFTLMYPEADGGGSNGSGGRVGGGRGIGGSGLAGASSGPQGGFMFLVDSSRDDASTAGGGYVLTVAEVEGSNSTVEGSGLTFDEGSGGISLDPGHTCDISHPPPDDGVASLPPLSKYSPFCGAPGSCGVPATSTSDASQPEGLYGNTDWGDPPYPFVGPIYFPRVPVLQVLGVPTRSPAPDSYALNMSREGLFIPPNPNACSCVDWDALQAEIDSAVGGMPPTGWPSISAAAEEGSDEWCLQQYYEQQGRDAALGWPTDPNYQLPAGTWSYVRQMQRIQEIREDAELFNGGTFELEAAP
jgi:RHS repeat-associated protein